MPWLSEFGNQVNDYSNFQDSRAFGYQGKMDFSSYAGFEEHKANIVPGEGHGDGYGDLMSVGFIIGAGTGDGCGFTMEDYIGFGDGSVFGYGSSVGAGSIDGSVSG